MAQRKDIPSFTMERPLKDIVHEVETLMPITKGIEKSLELILTDDEWCHVYWLLVMISKNFSQTTIDRWIEAQVETERYEQNGK